MRFWMSRYWSSNGDCVSIFVSKVISNINGRSVYNMTVLEAPFAFIFLGMCISIESRLARATDAQ